MKNAADLKREVAELRRRLSELEARLEPPAVPEASLEQRLRAALARWVALAEDECWVYADGFSLILEGEEAGLADWVLPAYQSDKSQSALNVKELAPIFVQAGVMDALEKRGWLWSVGRSGDHGEPEAPGPCVRAWVGCAGADYYAEADHPALALLEAYLGALEMQT